MNLPDSHESDSESEEQILALIRNHYKTTEKKLRVNRIKKVLKKISNELYNIATQEHDNFCKNKQ